MPLADRLHDVGHEFVDLLRRAADEAGGVGQRCDVDFGKGVEGSENLMPALLACARARVTVGEAIGALADVFGRHEAAVI